MSSFMTRPEIKQDNLARWTADLSPDVAKALTEPYVTNLSTRAILALANAELRTAEDIMAGADKLLSVPGVGKGTVEFILERIGLGGIQAERPPHFMLRRKMDDLAVKYGVSEMRRVLDSMSVTTDQAPESPTC